MFGYGYKDTNFLTEKQITTYDYAFTSYDWAIISYDCAITTYDYLIDTSIYKLFSVTFPMQDIGKGVFLSRDGTFY